MATATRLVKLTALLAALVIGGSSAAAACYKPPFSNPEGDIVAVCGDPRAFVRLDNTDARQTPAKFRVVFWSGKTGERKVVRKTVAAGDSLLIKRWVKGGNAKVSVYNDVTNALFERVTVRKVVQPWSAPECVAVRAEYEGQPS